MRNRFLVLLVIVAFVFVSSGQSMPTVRRSTRVRQRGRAFGRRRRGAGAVVGKDASGAVVGGLIGALVGGAIGHYYYDQKRTGTETAKKYDYDPSKGPTSNRGRLRHPADRQRRRNRRAEDDLCRAHSCGGHELALTEKREIRHDGAWWAIRKSA